jgi:uncharacterized membrane protein (UPF0136 family)
MNANLILWVYIVLLVAGGLVGFLKAGSKMSLIMSLGFAIPLALCAAGILTPIFFADILIGVLLVFFAMRFSKSKKFMPGGMMAGVSLVALVLRFLVK